MLSRPMRLNVSAKYKNPLEIYASFFLWGFRVKARELKYPIKLSQSKPPPLTPYLIFDVFMKKFTELYVFEIMKSEFIYMYMYAVIVDVIYDYHN